METLVLEAAVCALGNNRFLTYSPNVLLPIGVVVVLAGVTDPLCLTQTSHLAHLARMPVTSL